MKKNLAKIAAFTAVMGLALVGTAAHAQGVSSSTVNTLFDNSSSDTSETMYHALTIILSIAAALIGLGFGWRKLQQKATGKKF